MSVVVVVRGSHDDDLLCERLIRLRGSWRRIRLRPYPESLQRLDPEDRKDAVDEHRPGEQRDEPQNVPSA